MELIQNNKVKYLKHISKPDIEASLIDAVICKEITNEDNTTSIVISDPTKYLLSDVGLIYEPTGKMINGELGEYPEMMPICDDSGVPYYHFNLYSNQDIPDLKYEMNAPKNPVNIML